MRYVYAHFPINVNIEKNSDTGLFDVEIRCVEKACTDHGMMSEKLMRVLEQEFHWREDRTQSDNVAWSDDRDFEERER